MRKDNPLVKLERYRHIIERRQEIIRRIAREVADIEWPYLRIIYSEYCRYSVEIIHKRMSRDHKKRCKRLRSTRHKLNRSVDKMKWEIYGIERQLKKLDDFQRALYETEAAA